MKIYFDTCCYGRPFDDLTDVDICVENSAIVTLLAQCYHHSWTILGSAAVEFEIMQTPDIDTREKILLNYYSSLNEVIPFSGVIRKRALDVQRYGVKKIDSLHFAFAESANADALYTVDGGFLKCAKRIGSPLPVVNPVDWLSKGGNVS